MNQKEYYQTLLEALKRTDVLRRTALCDPDVGKEAIYASGQLLAATDAAGLPFSDGQVLEETLGCEVQLVIFGGGHIGLELYHMGVRLGHSITIIDDRQEYCNAERFPQARCLCTAYEELFTAEQPWIRPYFIIATRGHAYDELCLRHTLGLPHSYIGMIGSRSKIAKTFSNLAKDGFSAEQLAGVHAPIGLDINAVTASEIALAILGQIIAHYRLSKNSVRLDQQILHRQATGESHILARIVAKKGSAPCEIGFQLVRFPDGSLAGTVGGGVIEAEVIRALHQMAENTHLEDRIQRFSLDARKAGSLGMICGGEVEVLFQRR
jgi:xanthine dehydrogenase accessory factor